VVVAIAPVVAWHRGGLAQQPEGVREQRGDGRGEGAEQGLVVERVADHLQQAAQVLDLLLGPEAAAADDVGIETGLAEGALERGDVSEGTQQDDDLGRVFTGVDELTQAPARRRASATFEPELGSSGSPRQLCLLGLPRLLVVDGQQQPRPAARHRFPRAPEAGR